MGEWRFSIAELRKQINTLKLNNVTTISLVSLESLLNDIEDTFEIADKYTILDKINHPRREYDKNLDHYIKFLKEENTLYRQYTQLVISAGYATFFALWGISRPYMNPSQIKISFFLMLISVISFITLEVFKIGLLGFGLSIKNKALLAARVEDDLDSRLDHLSSADRYKNRFELWLSRIWVISYPISCISGLLALLILASSFISSIVS